MHRATQLPQPRFYLGPPRRSSVAIRILYQSRFTEMLGSCMDVLEDAAYQVCMGSGRAAQRLRGIAQS